MGGLLQDKPIKFKSNSSTGQNERKKKRGRWKEFNKYQRNGMHEMIGKNQG